MSEDYNYRQTLATNDRIDADNEAKAQPTNEVKPQIEIPNCIAVVSSNISHLGYDEKAREIWVRFTTGAIWVYGESYPSDFATLRDAPSIGGHFNRFIKPRPGTFPPRKISD
jgi:hypothetical protein